MIEAARTSETLVNFYQTTRRYNPENSYLRTHRRENLKSYLKSLPLQYCHIGSSASGVSNLFVCVFPAFGFRVFKLGGRYLLIFSITDTIVFIVKYNE
jgi:hypothetical protein